MEVKTILKEFGLKEKRADIYLACLELGTATASRIAKKAGVKRPYFYDIAEHLMKSGLIGQTKKGKHRYFFAVSPDKLMELEQEKMKKLEEAMPELKSLYNTLGTKPKIFYYEGKYGVEQLSNDALNYKGEALAFSTERFLTSDEQKLSQEFIKKRVKKKLKTRVIGPVSPEFLELKKRDAEELRETKMLPRDLYESNVEISMYGNKISIVNYKENFGFIIESSDVAKPLKQIFELIWRGGFVVE